MPYFTSRSAAVRILPLSLADMYRAFRELRLDQLKAMLANSQISERQFTGILAARWVADMPGDDLVQSLLANVGETIPLFNKYGHSFAAQKAQAILNGINAR